jgi:hypothetical protein
LAGCVYPGRSRQVGEPIGCFGSAINAINAGVDYIISLKKANPVLADRDQREPRRRRPGPGREGGHRRRHQGRRRDGRLGRQRGHGRDGLPRRLRTVISTGAGGWKGQWNEYPDKTWWLDDVPETGVDPVYAAGFSSRQLAGQYLDVVSTGRYLLLPYPCAQLYKDGQVISSTNVRTCASKATPDNAHAAPFQYLFISGTSFSAPTIARVAALMLDKHPSLNNADATFGTLTNPASWGLGTFEKLLQSSATDIPPGSVTVTHRTGDALLECWEVTVPGHPECTTQEATGHGWVFVDDTLAATPTLYTETRSLVHAVSSGRASPWSNASRR